MSIFSAHTLKKKEWALESYVRSPKILLLVIRIKVSQAGQDSATLFAFIYNFAYLSVIILTIIRIADYSADFRDIQLSLLRRAAV